MSLPKAVLFAAFITVFGLSYTGPIIEGDFFWHLRAGNTIWENKSIPSEYFSTQWLGQLILYFVWKLTGFTGIVLMRALIYSAILSFLFVWMRREGVSFFISLFFLLFPAHLLLAFPNERPQILSFLLFPLTLYLLEKFRKKHSQKDSTPANTKTKAVSYWFLPLLIALWANIHAGFMLGFVCIWIYFIAEIIYFLRKKTSLKSLSVIALIAVAPSVILLLVRPQTLTFITGVARSLLVPGAYMKSVQEYLSPITAALNLGEYFPSYWLFLLIAVFTLLRYVKIMPLHHVLLLIFFIALSLKSLRFMPFLTFLAPLVAVYGFRHYQWENSRVLFAGFTAILALWLIFVPLNINTGISENFPQDAVRFLQKTKPWGNIFNYQGWAGYLYWALPDRKIFVPVEKVTKEIDAAYEKIIRADKTPILGKPQWRAMLDAYRLDIIIMPGMSPISGEIYPLVDSLVSDNDWYLVYSDSVSNIFLRATPQNSRIIRIYSLPKGNVYLQIIAQAKRYLKDEPKRKTLWRSLSHAYKRLGLKEEADKALKKAIQS
jgi:hypothetical protein